MRKLNDGEEYDREIIQKGHQLEQDFLKYVEENKDFQNMIHTEGGFFSDEEKRKELSRLIWRFRRDNSDNYPSELHGYLDHYKDRLFDIAMGWKPLAYKKAEDNILEVPELRRYDAITEKKSEVADNGNENAGEEIEKSPFKKMKQTFEELDREQRSHFRFAEWDGKPFEHHNTEELQATKELLESPNYYEIIPSGEECHKDNSLYLTIDQYWFDKIVSGEKTVEYREIKKGTASKYLDLRESSDGYQLFSPFLPEGAMVYPDAYNEGIYGFTPRYYEYLRLAVGYNKDRDTAVIRIKGFCFVPEMYYKGGVWRVDFMDESITDEMWAEAVNKGKYALQDLLYKPDGPETNWTFAIHLGEIVELNKK